MKGEPRAREEIFAQSARRCSRCPEKFHGLSATRCATASATSNLIVNPQVREVFT
jgi:hypothetical protein